MSDIGKTSDPENQQNHDLVDGNVESDKPSQAEGDVTDANES
jgi:hypothetical protein